MSTAEFTRAEGHRDGYLEGLSAALTMTNRQAGHEPHLGEVALRRLAHDITAAISAAGRPDWKDTP